MQRINGPGAVNQRFSSGNPFTSQPATVVTPEWANAVQEEIARAIENAGLTLDPENEEQLTLAMQLQGGFGAPERAGLTAPAGLMNQPGAVAGARAAIPLFDLSGLWICGNSIERPYSAAGLAGPGTPPPACLTAAEFAAGVGSIDVQSLPGVVSPGVGFTFTVTGSGTVYTVSSITNYDFDAATCTINFTPNLAALALINSDVAFRTLVDNGAGYSPGATVIHIDGLIGRASMVGCRIKFAGHANVYTITSQTPWVTPGDCDVTISPALATAITDNEVVTVSQVFGTGGKPRGCELAAAYSSGVGTITVQKLPGVVEPGTGFSFKVGGLGTVYTISSTANFDHDAATCDITFTPNLAANHVLGDAVEFVTRVDNGAGYAGGSTVIHIDGLIDASPCKGTTIVFSGHATVYTITFASQFAAPGDCDITITPALTNAVVDNETFTISPVTLGVGTVAIDSVDYNTEGGGEYDVGRFPGQAWPYMVCDAQAAHNNPLGTGVNGAYPFSENNTGVNCYRKGFMLPRRACAAAFTLEMDFAGDFVQTETNCFLEWIIAPEFDPTVGFNLAGLHVAFQSSNLATIATRPFRVQIYMMGSGRTQSGNNYPITYACHFLVGNPNGSTQGCTAPVLDEWRFVQRAQSGAIHNWRRKDTRVVVLWKFEKNTLIGSPGRRGAAVQASHISGGNLMRMSRSTARIWCAQH